MFCLLLQVIGEMTEACQNNTKKVKHETPDKQERGIGVQIRFGVVTFICRCEYDRDNPEQNPNDVQKHIRGNKG